MLHFQKHTTLSKTDWIASATHKNLEEFVHILFTTPNQPPYVAFSEAYNLIKKGLDCISHTQEAGRVRAYLIHHLQGKQ